MSTNRERQDLEIKVLRSIFGSDLVFDTGKGVLGADGGKKRKGKDAMGIYSFSLRVTPHLSTENKEMNTKRNQCWVTLRIMFPPQYPDVPLILGLDSMEGLDSNQHAELKELVEQRIGLLEGEEMTYEVSQVVKEYLVAVNEQILRSMGMTLPTIDKESNKEGTDEEVEQPEPAATSVAKPTFMDADEFALVPYPLRPSIRHGSAERSSAPVRSTARQQSLGSKKSSLHAGMMKEERERMENARKLAVSQLEKKTQADAEQRQQLAVDLKSELDRLQDTADGATPASPKHTPKPPAHSVESPMMGALPMPSVEENALLELDLSSRKGLTLQQRQMLELARRTQLGASISPDLSMSSQVTSPPPAPLPQPEGLGDTSSHAKNSRGKQRKRHDTSYMEGVLSVGDGDSSIRSALSEWDADKSRRGSSNASRSDRSRTSSPQRNNASSPPPSTGEFVISVDRSEDGSEDTSSSSGSSDSSSDDSDSSDNTHSNSHSTSSSSDDSSSGSDDSDSSSDSDSDGSDDSVEQQEKQRHRIPYPTGPGANTSGLLGSSSFLSSNMQLFRSASVGGPVHGSLAPTAHRMMASGVDRGEPTHRHKDRKPTPHFSRLEADFELLGGLGRGGFGQVLKCRNRIDGLVYAVKKIPMKAGKKPRDYRKIIREVSTLATLHHRYIVRYLGAWIEYASTDSSFTMTERGITDFMVSEAGASTHASSDGPESESSTYSDSESLEDSGDVASSHHTSSSKRGSTLYTSNTPLNSEMLQEMFAPRLDVGNLLNNAAPPSVIPGFAANAIGVRSPAKPKPKVRMDKRVKGALKKKKKRKAVAYLYIQMEYCELKTLRTLIDQRPSKKKAEVPDGEDEEQEPPEQKPLSERADAIWRLFRQILEAMEFIHRKGVIHRDIKPPNIFIDGQGNIKLGDFGLAVSKRKKIRHTESKKPSAAEDGSNDDGDKKPSSQQDPEAGKNEAKSSAKKPRAITEVVGTPFYRSPEQEAVGVEYDHKADMYALGILFYEMWKPFATGMERYIHLTNLRETGDVEEGFLEDTEHGEYRDKVVSIIRSLLARDPAERPDAGQLLRSGLVPLKIEDEYMDQALKTVVEPESYYHQRLLEMLFGSVPSPIVDFTFDYRSRSQQPVSAVPGMGLQQPSARLYSSLPNSVASGFDAAHLSGRVYSHCVSFLIAIFERHGATHLSTPLLMPRTGLAPHRSNPRLVTMLDSHGTLLQLPFTLTVPFARYAAQQRPLLPSSDSRSWTATDFGSLGVLATDAADHARMDLRRWDIGKVYRVNPTGGRPTELTEVSYDIVWVRDSPVDIRGRSSRRSRLACISEKALCTEAEVMRCLFEVYLEHSWALGGICLMRYNHLAIFDACVDTILWYHYVHSYMDAAAARIRRDQMKAQQAEAEATTVSSTADPVGPEERKDGWEEVTRYHRDRAQTDTDTDVVAPPPPPPNPGLGMQPRKQNAKGKKKGRTRRTVRSRLKEKRMRRQARMDKQKRTNRNELLAVDDYADVDSQRFKRVDISARKAPQKSESQAETRSSNETESCHQPTDSVVLGLGGDIFDKAELIKLISYFSRLKEIGVDYKASAAYRRLVEQRKLHPKALVKMNQFFCLAGGVVGWEGGSSANSREGAETMPRVAPNLSSAGSSQSSARVHTSTADDQGAAGFRAAYWLSCDAVMNSLGGFLSSALALELPASTIETLASQNSTEDGGEDDGPAFYRRAIFAPTVFRGLLHVFALSRVAALFRVPLIFDPCFVSHKQNLCFQSVVFSLCVPSGRESVFQSQTVSAPKAPSSASPAEGSSSVDVEQPAAPSTHVPGTLGLSALEQDSRSKWYVLAAGGRYDHLVARFTAPTADVNTHLGHVGFSLSMDRLVAACVRYQLNLPETQKYRQRRKKAQRKAALSPFFYRSPVLQCANSRRYVLLYCKGGLLMYERAALAVHLWSIGIPCSFAHPRDLPLHKVSHYGREMGARFVVYWDPASSGQMRSDDRKNLESKTSTVGAGEASPGGRNRRVNRTDVGASTNSGGVGGDNGEHKETEGGEDGAGERMMTDLYASLGTTYEPTDFIMRGKGGDSLLESVVYGEIPAPSNARSSDRKVVYGGVVRSSMVRSRSDRSSKLSSDDSVLRNCGFVYVTDLERAEGGVVWSESDDSRMRVRDVSTWILKELAKDRLPVGVTASRNHLYRNAQSSLKVENITGCPVTQLSLEDITLASNVDGEEDSVAGSDPSGGGGAQKKFLHADYIREKDTRKVKHKSKSKNPDSRGRARLNKQKHILRKQVLETVTRLAGPTLSALPADSYKLACVDLPIRVIRGLISAFYEEDPMSAAAQKVAEIDRCFRSLGGELVGYLSVQRADWLEKNSKLVGTGELFYIYVFSYTDRQIDVLTLQ